jgi:carbohydrate diacid regulator
MIRTKLQQLQELLGASAEIRVLSREEWERDGGSRNPEPGDYVTLPRGIRAVVRIDGTELQVLETDSVRTPLEKELLKFALQQPAGRNASAASDIERQSRRLGEWILQAVGAGEWKADVPNRFELHSRMPDGMIPFLIQYERSEEREIPYGELHKAVRSFLSDGILLIPLREQEWLVLGPDRLLSEADMSEEEAAGQEETKEVLASLGYGLHQMITGEWGGECHVAVGFPIEPKEELVGTAVMLRETIDLGRKFHMGQQVHLPWLVHLERLIQAVPESALSRLTEQLSGYADLFGDNETVATLDIFFANDCNVSETAKKLFIHRNTLLYRLDKIKQESGLDVRSFNDAVLARIMLLLYKITKRK